MKREYDFSAAERGRFYRESAKLRLPASDEEPNWIGPAGQLGGFLVEEAERTLASYRAQPRRVTEDANSEQSAAHGGYAHRQLFELVQNSADALLGAPKGQSILIRLTERFLYCADDGAHVDEDGIVGLMFSRMSSKRSSKRNIRPIGRFGLGFKSVLGVTDAPEFYSRSASFRFDKTRAVERIAKVAPADRYPVLRLPEPIDPNEARSTDEELSELMSWATNIVRLPLKMGAHDDLAKQIRDFPPEFLLFVDHVRYLTLEDGERSRDFMLHRRMIACTRSSGSPRARCRIRSRSSSFRSSRMIGRNKRPGPRNSGCGRGQELGGLCTPYYYPARSCPVMGAGTTSSPWIPASTNRTTASCALLARPTGRMTAATCRPSRVTRRSGTRVGAGIPNRTICRTIRISGICGSSHPRVLVRWTFLRSFPMRATRSTRTRC